MSDIFLSYAREDLDRAAVLARRLEDEGFSVWWDREIPPGRSWAEVIEEQITECRVVAVLWTTVSVEKRWVQKEARKGEQRRNLIPVLLDPVPVPFEFEHVQAAHLVEWSGDRDDEAFRQLVQEISSHVSPSEEPVPHPPEPGRRWLWLIPLLLAATAVAAAAVVERPTVPVRFEGMALHGLSVVLGTGDSGSTAAFTVATLDVSLAGLDELASVVVRPPELDALREYRRVPSLGLLPVGEEENRGLEIPAFPLGPGDSLEIQGDPGTYRLSVTPATDWTLGLSGSWRLQRGAREDTIDFGSGGSIVIRSAGRTHLDFDPAGAAQSPTLVRDLPVAALALFRYDAFVGEGELSSTVARGSLEFPGNDPVALGPSTLLGLDGFDGRLGELRIEDELLRAEFAEARADGIRVDGTSLMPTWLGSMTPVQKGLGAALILGYGVWCGRRLRRSRERL